MTKVSSSMNTQVKEPSLMNTKSERTQLCIADLFMRMTQQLHVTTVN